MSKLISEKVEKDLTQAVELLQPFSKEYIVDVSIKVIEGNPYYHIFLIPNREDVKFVELDEVYGTNLEELRLNFFIKLAELREKELKKHKKIEKKST